MKAEDILYIIKKNTLHPLSKLELTFPVPLSPRHYILCDLIFQHAAGDSSFVEWSCRCFSSGAPDQLILSCIES